MYLSRRLRVRPVPDEHDLHTTGSAVLGLSHLNAIRKVNISAVSQWLNCWAHLMVDVF